MRLERALPGEELLLRELVAAGGTLDGIRAQMGPPSGGGRLMPRNRSPIHPAREARYARDAGLRGLKKKVGIDRRTGQAIVLHDFGEHHSEVWRAAMLGMLGGAVAAVTLIEAFSRSCGS